jgi:hypothetical protein
MMQVATLLLTAAFTYVVTLAAGKTLLHALRINLYRSEEYYFGFVLGSCILSCLVFALTALHLAYTSVFLTLGLAILGLAVARGAYRFSGQSLPPLPRVWQIGFGLCYAIFAVVYLEAALLPEVGADAVLYHVALPARYFREHCFPPNTRNLMANLSEGVEMIFLFAYPFAKLSAGAIVHLLFTLVTPLGMLSYARRTGFPIAGVAAALLFFLTPIVGKLGTTGYIDVAVACILFAAYYLLEIWRLQHSTRLLVAIGLLAGFCFAAKYTASLAIPYALAVVAWECWRSREPFWRPVAIVGLYAFATMAPYLVKNAIFIGNPVAPFANSIFPNRLMTVSQERSYADGMRHWQGVRMAEVPLEVTLHGGRLQGIVGPVFLLAPLALLALRFSIGRRLLLAGAFFSLTYFASIATRFLVPSLPFLSLALACALPRVSLPVLVLAHAILSWPSVVPRYTDRACWRLQKLVWHEALRQRPESDFVGRILQEYAMGLSIESKVPRGEPILAFNAFQQAYQSHEIIVGWQSAFGKGLMDAMLTPVMPDRSPTSRLMFQFPEKALRKVRLVQQDLRAEDEWSVTELRISRGGTDLLRAPQWRLRASHNIWTVQSAFDNNPVTRWSSGQPRSPGMWLEVDFGKEEYIDSVVVEQTEDLSQAALSLEYKKADGAWLPLPADTAKYKSELPDDFRIAATDTIKLNHVYWLLVKNTDPYAADISSHPEKWKATLVAADNTYGLYHLE